MRILSIDTTTMQGSVALSEGDLLIAQEQHGIRATHSERLLASIDHLLSMAKWSRSEIEGIAVALGPGSFTGLRIGLATAKGMALAIGCPIVGVSSLECLALNGRGAEGTVVSLIDAKRGELYAAAYRIPWEGRLQTVMEECVLGPDELVKRLETIEASLILVGDGVIRYGSRLQEALGGRASMPKGVYSFPQAHNLAILALERLGRGEHGDLASLAPNYIRRSDAEIGFKGGRGRRKAGGSKR
jgi:tRNA threonylcarbamoyladenosine biosynthesis protein TsaB